MVAVAIGVVLLQFQFLYLKGCILSKAEFGSDEACIPYYLQKWKLVQSKERTKTFVRYVLPLIVLVLALLLQIATGHRPFLF